MSARVDMSTCLLMGVREDWRTASCGGVRVDPPFGTFYTADDAMAVRPRSSEPIDLSAYVRETLREDGELALSRGRHATRHGEPSILLLTPIATRPSPATVAKLGREYALAADFEPAWAVVPRALVDDDGRPALVLDDPGGEPLDRLVDAPMEPGSALRIAVGLAHALSELHGLGLIHKDVKPANALVDRAMGEARLMGFGIASRLPRQRQAPEPPEIIAGTLAYMAPEQTGRMNRSVDARSDLYALGVTLYELLTASLPFTASDPMEWVHCHIARVPVPPAERLRTVPEALSTIVMKLLAKAPEDRYQTAAGVKHDLRRCLAAWGNRGRIVAFSLGERDLPDRLQIPERLYGRAREVETLLDAFGRVVRRGTTELVLVAGSSGVGKSAVVHELHKALVPTRGLFAAGKFDQYRRDVPYATLAQAFRSLVQHLLCKRDAELAGWRDALTDALGANAQLIVDVVPELTLVVGEPTPVLPLPVHDAHNHVQRVFRRFLGVFARPDHPLALFLDDLQWLDAATLDLLEILLSEPDVGPLLLIGAYRNDEIDGSHPLTRRLAAMRGAGASVQEIALAPLGCDDVGQLIADALRAERGVVAPLARLVHEKTAGTPFFVTQFLQALADERLLELDHGRGRWTWNLERIRAARFTDNVVELMVGKLGRLSAGARKALQELACLGNEVDVATAAIAFAGSEAEVHAALEETVQQQLIERTPTGYRFVHDRVQEAARSLVSEESRAAVHLGIGWRLAAALGPDRVFDVVNQLNRGAQLIASRDEREQVAELNLLAGERAKASTAYVSALAYLTAGAALLTDDRWERCHDLAFALELHRAECEFLTGDLPAAEARLAAVSQHAKGAPQRAAVVCLRADLYTTLGDTDRAVAVCLDYLRGMAIEWSPHPTDAEARQEYDAIWRRLAGRPIESLVDLPAMTDPESLATVDVLTTLGAPAIITDPNLYALVSCRAVNISLEGGNSDGAPPHYALLGLLAGARFADYAAGFRFGKAACELVERRGFARFAGKTLNAFGRIVPWTRPVREAREPIRRAFRVANEAGDLTFASYACLHLNSNMLAAGDPLEEVEREVEHGWAFARAARFDFVIDTIAAQRQLVRMLRGKTPRFGCFDDASFAEDAFERHLARSRAFAQPECLYWIRRLEGRFFAGDYVAATYAAERARRLFATAPSVAILLADLADYHFFAALARAAWCRPPGSDGDHDDRDALAAHHRRLADWAVQCPENFDDRVALVGAEIARLERRDADAMELYERAIASARTNGFVHHEALAYELAGRFYAARGFETTARAYVREARAGYERWGAIGKVRQLDATHPDAAGTACALGPTTTMSAPIEGLDLATVIAVSNAIARETVLDQLIEAVMRTTIEQAGAERAVLLLRRGVDHRLVAEAATAGDAVVVRMCDEAAARAPLPHAIVQYVVRTLESVIVDDMGAQNPFSADEYVRAGCTRSACCVPLVNQGHLVGVLYLENGLAARVFTPTRLAVLRVLASQAAISLEKARLYRELEAREARLRRLVDANLMGVFTWRRDGRITEANDAFLRMIGYEREDLASGRIRWADLSPVEWREADERAIAEIQRTGTAQPYEKEVLRKDGSRVPVLIGEASLHEADNDGIAFALDLTPRKQAEAALADARAVMTHVARVATVGEVTGSLAHELKQPLAAILNNASASLALLDGARPDLAELREALRDVVHDADRAAGIIDGVQRLARRSPPEHAPLSLSTVVDEVVALAAAEARARRVAVHTDVPADLPVVIGDRVQLQQVLLNLVMNGMDAMGGVDASERRLVIRGSRDVDEGRPAVRISVEDSGIGLGDADVEPLFAAFYTTKAHGMGLGLAISRSIIEGHGGRLWAEPNRRAGATFSFRLPAEPEPSTDPP